MPDGQYSFYLHSDDRTDIAAMATISTISQPLRGEFIRTAATAGAVVYQVDARLPALIPVFFAGQLSSVRLCFRMSPKMVRLLCLCHRRQNTSAGVTP
ncbi:mediator of plasmid stability [Klebsiella pneumoniae]|nr:mediator of plasmid stability [Klebsiella pneumoniae]